MSHSRSSGISSDAGIRGRNGEDSNEDNKATLCSVDDSQGLRLGYVSGPVDAAKVYDEWKSCKASEYYGTLYLLDLYQIAETLRANVLIVTTLPEKRPSEYRPGLRIVNHPLPEQSSGLSYHLAMLGWALRCIITLVRFHANAVLLTAGQDYFWPFAALRLFGARILVSLHCTLWPKFANRKRHQRVLDWLNGHLLYPASDHIQANSDEALDQLRLIAPRLKCPPVRYLATYDATRFVDSHPPEFPPSDSRFNLLYVGRIARNKGVIDAVHILRGLDERYPGKYALRLCGSGPDEAALASAIQSFNLSEVVTACGECSAERLHEFYAWCHLVLVPTRSDFEEGQPKVAFEAVLNRRPLVMSAACPALRDVQEATIEPRVDDIEDYLRAIERLSQDRELYEGLVEGANVARPRFLDEKRGYQSVLADALRRTMGSRSIG